MYILVRQGFTHGISINACAHASLACYLKFKDDPDMQYWLETSFKKVTCKVTEEQLAECKKAGDFVHITESNLGNVLVAVAFKPRENYPDIFKELRLY